MNTVAGRRPWRRSQQLKNAQAVLASFAPMSRRRRADGGVRWESDAEQQVEQLMDFGS